MPLLLFFDNAEVKRGVSALAVGVVVNRAVSGVRVTATTARVRTVSRLYLSTKTQDPAVFLPPPSASGGAPGGGGAAGAGTAIIVSHSGLPETTTDYTITGSTDGGVAGRLPRLSATIHGRVNLSGDLHIGVRVGDHAQVYGPFGKVGQTFQQTPTGWVTQVQSLDTSAADVDPDSPLISEFEEEFLPWERERDLTPREQAERQRAEEVEKRALDRVKKRRQKAIENELKRDDLSPEQKRTLRRQLRLLKKTIKPIPDRRHVPVQDVINHALTAMPMPFKLGGPLPYGGDYFWADPDTGRDFNGGKLKGVSFQVKGQTPIQVLESLLSPIGWQIVIRFGTAYIGTAEALATATETPGLLELPDDLLTGVSIEQVNPDVVNGKANAQLPRKVTVTGAVAIRQLEPLYDPSDDDEDTKPDKATEFSGLANGELVQEGVDTSPHPLTRAPRTDAAWKSVKTKRDHLLVKETYVRHGIVPSPEGKHVTKTETSGAYVNTTYTMLTESWQLIEDRSVTYDYDDEHYPQAETRQESVKREWKGGIPFIVPPIEGLTAPEKAAAVVRSEESVTTSEWSKEGWLKRRTTVTTTYEDFKWFYGAAAPAGRPVVETTTEEWTPINKDLWQVVRTKRWQGWENQTDENGELDEPLPVLKTTREPEITDQGPPRAPDADKDDKGDDDDEKDDADNEPTYFPYDDPLAVTVYPGGRGDPVTRNAPWATSIDPQWAEDVIATIRRARPAQRTRYSMAAPPALELGTRVREFSISGRGGGVEASITVEEALDV